jgi:hypothetical protein
MFASHPALTISLIYIATTIFVSNLPALWAWRTGVKLSKRLVECILTVPVCYSGLFVLLFVGDYFADPTQYQDQVMTQSVITMIICAFGCVLCALRYLMFLDGELVHLYTPADQHD